jgi:hypothetical protein
VRMSDMAQGDIAVIDEDSPTPFHGHLVLRVWEHIVSLTKHGVTWSYNSPIRVRVLRPTSALTFIVK